MEKSRPDEGGEAGGSEEGEDGREAKGVVGSCVWQGMALKGEWVGSYTLTVGVRPTLNDKRVLDGWMEWW